ncbi:hypothetical protein [Alteromonas macleodii]|uniref:hypothetical protein n=1 Tax=Alteromonas macleodii TaxID=28108 RepID=UPI00243244A8|nr:hypothetical protein [Alteromonas macleodii]
MAWQLRAGTSIDVITRQYVTISAMIEQYYSNVKPEMFADALPGITFEPKKASAQF